MKLHKCFLFHNHSFFIYTHYQCAIIISICIRNLIKMMKHLSFVMMIFERERYCLILIKCLSLNINNIIVVFAHVMIGLCSVQGVQHFLFVLSGFEYSCFFLSDRSTSAWCTLNCVSKCCLRCRSWPVTRTAWPERHGRCCFSSCCASMTRCWPRPLWEVRMSNTVMRCSSAFNQTLH